MVDLLKKTVRPEFVNRIDEIIMFRPLSKRDIRKIVDIQVGLVQKRLEENGVRRINCFIRSEKLARGGFAADKV